MLYFMSEHDRSNLNKSKTGSEKEFLLIYKVGNRAVSNLNSSTTKVYFPSM